MFKTTVVFLRNKTYPRCLVPIGPQTHSTVK